MTGRVAVEIRPLLPSDDRAGFRCGDEALDLYFHRYAGQNQFRHHIGVTYVAVDQRRILGFATVSPASLDAEDLPSGRKLPPYPLPVLRIARLALDEAARGSGLGEALLRFTIELAEKMRTELGCVGLIVDAKAAATKFYEKYGFARVEAETGMLEVIPTPNTMYLPLGAVPTARP